MKSTCNLNSCLKLKKITFDTLLTPNFRRIGNARKSCTDFASLKND